MLSLWTCYTWVHCTPLLHCSCIIRHPPSEKQHVNTHADTTLLRHKVKQLPALVNYWHVTKQAIINFVNLVKLCHHWLIRSDFAPVIGWWVHTRVYTHTHTHSNRVLYFLHWAVWLASSQATECQRVKGDHCLAALVSCASAPLWMCVCVSVCAVNMTAWPLWLRLLSWSFLPYIYTNNNPLYTLLCTCQEPWSPPSASIMVPPLLLISQPSITYSLILSASSAPSLLLAQIDRTESLGLFINPSETHIV